MPCQHGCTAGTSGALVVAVQDDVNELGTLDLVTGIVDDARDLVGAHVEALREDMSARLTILGATLTSLLIAIGVFVVTALLLGLAIATSLAALGVPWWLALWIVTLAAAAIGVAFVFRARSKARPAPPLTTTTHLLSEEPT